MNIYLMTEGYFEFGIVLQSNHPLNRDIRWGKFIVETNGDPTFCYYLEATVSDELIKKKIIEELRCVN